MIIGGGALVGGDELGDNDKVTQAFQPDARACASNSQYALKFTEASTDAPGTVKPNCGPIPATRDSNGHKIGAQPLSAVTC